MSEFVNGIAKPNLWFREVALTLFLRRFLVSTH